MTATSKELEKEPVFSKGKSAVAGNGAEAVDEEAPEVVKEPGLQEIMTSYEQTLAKATELYQAQVAELEASAQQAAQQAIKLEAGPITSFFGITYPWWNLLVLGPFQRVAPLGPFRPSKIIRHNEAAYMVAALWRNPRPLPGGPNPSAAQIMSPFRFRIRGEVINLTNVTSGPNFQPITGTFGPGFTNIYTMSLPAMPAPVDGRPNLYEVNFTVDVLGPSRGLPPFAGYSTWVYDPDREPPFVFPRVVLPDGRVISVRVPGSSGGLQHDTPARFLVYV